jgi:branched-chain amino acid aminotransferase
MNIEVHPCSPLQYHRLPDFNNLEFGKHYTDHMFSMEYSPEKGWHNATVGPYKELSLSPATLVLHYAQEIFEGLKAYTRVDGNIGLFRPRENFIRMNNSAKRMNMPTFDVETAMKGLLELLRLDKRWVPPQEGASLYIRPTMIATDAIIGLKPSTSYLFYIIMSPVGPYFKIGEKGLNIFVEEKYVRAVRGGIGEAKAGANYAASLLAATEAKKKGFADALWLDGVERRYIEEVGTMNIFFAFGDMVMTPKLNGSILPGITRRSIIELMKMWGNPVTEESIDIDSLITDINSGACTECFGSGTAAVISPVGSLNYKNFDHPLSGGKIGPMSQKIFKALTDIQYGKAADTLGWTLKI